MSAIALLLEILRGANLLTPAIAGIIGIVKSGKESGKTDDEIKAESMQFALETRQITEEDMRDDSLPHKVKEQE